MNPRDSKSIALPKTLTDLLEQRARSLVELRALKAAIDRAEAVLPGRRLPADFSRVFTDDMRPWIREMDQRLWREAMGVSGMSDVMDEKARAAFRASLESSKCPEFTEDNVRATFVELLPKRELMFRRGLVTIFRRLSREYARHADAAFKMPRKVIVQRLATSAYGSGFMRVNYYIEDTVSDLDRVLCKLAGQPFKDRAMSCAMTNAWEKGELFTCPWFTAKAFKNGNVHITWTDLEMLDRINGIIADYYGDHAVGDSTRSAA